ncbi:Pyridoxal 5'-phosphate synthase subunit PdxS [Candidatus Nitrosocosmicus franklandus]|uniref:pyridoxal 5'-phosphate synthase (glutamine hydrolyzing) n=1 Tax=Candidatus Nitrosocosmicus franklandianus TaxID=1798806 RepID=A0A484I5J1_9ARCH|nr:pyridoxal 5'-phosphate synthase lyase subunit PdxS [Candidatus Nitrosocosmicus franklandus]VFJ12999.1 Pyridoxal 5'-phosphate synthase subunit PdxS [Candidatus Nitrosocosmicus franklandus]
MAISLVPWNRKSERQEIFEGKNNRKTKGSVLVKRGFAHMQKHGVIMDVTSVEQAQIAEESGAVAVMVLDKLPFDVRKAGGVARTAGVKIIQDIMDSVSIPIMAKCRIGHVAEAEMLETCGVDMVDESEVLTPADDENHIWKWDFTVPFVNGAKNLGEALRRIEEGASMIRTKGEPGTGNVAEAVNHIKILNKEVRMIRGAYADNDFQELIKLSRKFRVSLEMVKEVGKLGRLPVVNFAAGGITTPSDAAFLMRLGCDGVFVGSGIFKSEDPSLRARAVVLATTFFDDDKTLLEAQKMIDEKKSLVGLDTKNLELRMQERGPVI